MIYAALADITNTEFLLKTFLDFIIAIKIRDTSIIGVSL